MNYLLYHVIMIDNDNSIIENLNSVNEPHPVKLPSASYMEWI